MSTMPARSIVGVARPGTFARTLLLGCDCENPSVYQLLGLRAISGNISDMARASSVTLLGRRHSIETAEHTLKTALSALKQGNARLASSRTVTAIIQASIASVGAPAPVVRRAEAITFEGRRIIQHLVLARAARLGLLSRWGA
jgi:hypothetical protein